MNKRIIVIGRMTAFPDLDAKCIHKKFKVPFINCDSINSDSNGVDELSQRANSYLESISNKYSEVTYVDFNNMLCDENGCSPFLNENLVYFDSTHLSVSGSRLLGVEILKENSLNSLLFNISQ
ncbi:SGNH hydrolase domain-containing protein [Nitrincola sp. A-D6]|uniref:SGNH hydrolase domain-containing protein n=1 Tax=Nitrincola sp. A-D6 TaxID=1545442 RepID=UPI00118477AC|nr:SGNH hydrolase domain-containing protein [Nitrincola sp. A-D6]